MAYSRSRIKFGIGSDMLKSIPKEAMDKILARIPLGRLGRPSEVAKAVAYLVSDGGIK